MQLIIFIDRKKMLTQGIASTITVLVAATIATNKKKRD